MAKLWQVMESLVSFTDEEVFVVTEPTRWMELRLPRSMEPIPWDPLTIAAAAIAEATGPTQGGLCQ